MKKDNLVAPVACPLYFKAKAGGEGARTKNGL